MRANPSFRQINQYEKEILDILLKEYFSGRDEIREQITTAKVRKSCSCGCNSIEFFIISKAIVPTFERVPVEASYLKNKKPFQILLHIIKGKVSELEFVSYSDVIDTSYPKVKALKVKINEKY